MAKTVRVNGVEVVTNYGSRYSLDNGNGRKTMDLHSKGLFESDEKFLARLVKQGYKKISFFYVTTSVRGYYNTIAYCK